jgi:hypothetical protein
MFCAEAGAAKSRVLPLKTATPAARVTSKRASVRGRAGTVQIGDSSAEAEMAEL